MREATYRIVKHGRFFIGSAENYEQGVLIGTGSHPSYTGAREELQLLADGIGVRLRWFEGEAECSVCRRQHGREIEHASE